MALVLESYRLRGEIEEAQSFLAAEPLERRGDLWINVLALFQRDAGDEAGARQLLESAASAFPNTPLQAALGSPLDRWPSGLEAMTAIPIEELNPTAGVGRRAFGGTP